jgi:hypothetical protein
VTGLPAGQPEPKAAERDPGAAAGILLGPAFVAAIVGAMRLARRPFPRPDSAAADFGDYYRGSARAARFSAAGQAVSVVALARFTIAVTRLAGRAGPASPLLPITAAASGAASVALLAASAATQASLAGSGDRDDDAVASLARRVFVLGGPIHGAAYGIFTGVATAAAHRAGLLGRGGTAIGAASAASGVLAPLYFRWEQAGWLIPIGRFSGYVLDAVIGARLPRRPT